MHNLCALGAQSFSECVTEKWRGKRRGSERVGEREEKREIQTESETERDTERVGERGTERQRVCGEERWRETERGVGREGEPENLDSSIMPVRTQVISAQPFEEALTNLVHLACPDELPRFARFGVTGLDHFPQDFLHVLIDLLLRAMVRFLGDGVVELGAVEGMTHPIILVMHASPAL